MPSRASAKKIERHPRLAASAPPTMGAAPGPMATIRFIIASRRAASCGRAVSRTMARPITMPGAAAQRLQQPGDDQAVDVRRESRGEAGDRVEHEARPSAPAGVRSDRRAARRRAGRPRGRGYRRSRSSCMPPMLAPRSSAASGRAGTKMCMASVPLKVISVSSQSGAVTPRPRRRVERAADMLQDPDRRLDVPVGEAGQRVAPDPARHRLDLSAMARPRAVSRMIFARRSVSPSLRLDQAGRLEIVEQANDRGAVERHRCREILLPRRRRRAGDVDERQPGRLGQLERLQAKIGGAPPLAGGARQQGAEGVAVEDFARRHALVIR